MRHATTEKTNDPLRLKLDDCSAQRNLSSLGKTEAKRVGKAFRDHSVPIEKILASRYCRTQETAKLAFGDVAAWQPLDLLYALPEEDRDTQTEIVTEKISLYTGKKNLVLVTHRPNIDALTFEVVEPGEFLVLKPDGSGGLDIIGRLTPNNIKTGKQ